MQNIVTKPQTMTSRELHKLVYEATGKFKEIKHFHEKCKKVLVNFDGRELRPSLDSRGYVDFYNLNEVQCNMVMASVDINHLQLISEVFVKVKERVEPKPQIPTDELSLALYAATQNRTKILEMEAKQKALEEKQEEHESILNRHGAPFGFMGIKKFATTDSHHLSTKAYKEIAEAYHVETKPYMTQTPQGFEVAATGYNIDELRTATLTFIEESEQLTPAFVTHPENGIRAKYVKAT